MAAAGSMPAGSIVLKSVLALAAGKFGDVSADAAKSTDAVVPIPCLSTSVMVRS